MILRCLSAAAVGGAVAWFYGTSRWQEEMELVEQYRVLCDAFSIPGILMVLFAMLFSLNNLGALDTIAYLMSFLPRMIAPGAFGEPEKLIDFVENRRQKRSKGYGFLYIVGFIFLGIAIVYLVLFYKVF
jgi:hypothetical protein